MDSPANLYGDGDDEEIIYEHEQPSAKRLRLSSPLASSSVEHSYPTATEQQVSDIVNVQEDASLPAIPGLFLHGDTIPEIESVDRFHDSVENVDHHQQHEDPTQDRITNPPSVLHNEQQHDQHVDQDSLMSESETHHAKIVSEDEPTTIDSIVDQSVTKNVDHAVANNNSTTSQDQDTSGDIMETESHMLDRKGMQKMTEEEREVFLQQGEANKEDPEAEWQLDSSDEDVAPKSATSSDSSSDDSSSDDSDSDDDEDSVNGEAEDQVLREIQEEARRIMQAEDGSDDDENHGANKESSGAGGVLRTKNEIVDDQQAVKRPEIEITPDMEMTFLGTIESVVGLMILVRASTSGEYQVLNEGSLLTTEGRSVLGYVQDILGRVEEPLYTVRFNNEAELTDLGVQEGKKVFYIPQHSTFVFTKALKAIKGSDASNIYDEEVGEEEQEFSDDEAEAEFKRKQKSGKKAKNNANNTNNNQNNSNHFSNGNQKEAPIHMSYDEENDASSIMDEPYVPLARPQNLHEMVQRNSPVIDRSAPSGGNTQRGRGKDRRGGGGGGGNQRGGHNGRHENKSFRSPNRNEHDNRRGRGNSNFSPRGGRGNNFQGKFNRGGASNTPGGHQNMEMDQEYAGQNRQEQNTNKWQPPALPQNTTPAVQLPQTPFWPPMFPNTNLPIPPPPPPPSQMPNFNLMQQFGIFPPSLGNGQFNQQQQQQQQQNFLNHLQNPAFLPQGAHVNPAFFNRYQSPNQHQTLPPPPPPPPVGQYSVGNQQLDQKSVQDILQALQSQQHRPQ